MKTFIKEFKKNLKRNFYIFLKALLWLLCFSLIIISAFLLAIFAIYIIALPWYYFKSSFGVYFGIPAYYITLFVITLFMVSLYHTIKRKHPKFIYLIKKIINYINTIT